MCVHVKQICSKSGILWLIDRGRHAGPWAPGLLAVPTWGRGPGSKRGTGGFMEGEPDGVWMCKFSLYE